MWKFIGNLIVPPYLRVIEVDGMFYPQRRIHPAWVNISPESGPVGCKTLQDAMRRIQPNVVWTN